MLIVQAYARTMATEQDPAAAPPSTAGTSTVRTSTVRTGVERRTIDAELDWRSVVWLLASLAALGFVATMFARASSVIVVFIVALFTALALDPLVHRLERAGCRRGWAVVIVVGAATAALVLFVSLAGPGLVRETGSLGADLPRTVDSLTDLPLVGGWLRSVDAPARVSEFLDSIPKRIQSDDADLGALARGLGLGLGVAVLWALAVVGVLVDGPRLIAAVRRAVPPTRRHGLDDIGRIVYDVIARYFAGSLLIAVINGVWVAVAALVAGVPLGPVLGVWAALTSLIPQIGGLLGFAVVALVSLSAGLGPTVVMCVAFLFIMLLTNHVLQPTIVGRAVSLSAPVTMLSTIVGLTVAGVPGALFAVPTTGAVKAVAQHVRGVEPARVEPRAGLLERVRRRRHGAAAPGELNGRATSPGPGDDHPPG